MMNTKMKRPAASSIFLSQRTPETEKAVAALQHVFDKLGARGAEATYATALSERLLKHWKRSEKVTQYFGLLCVQRFVGKSAHFPTAAVSVRRLARTIPRFGLKMESRHSTSRSLTARDVDN
jgi:hypothetical protein